MWEGHDVDPDERTARVKGNERPLPPPLLLQLPLCTSRIDGCCLTILVAKATKMEISHSSKAERRGARVGAQRVPLTVLDLVQEMRMERT